MLSGLILGKKQLFRRGDQAMGSEITLPILLAERASKAENEVALRQKHLGIWNEITWGSLF